MHLSRLAGSGAEAAEKILIRREKKASCELRDTGSHRPVSIATLITAKTMCDPEQNWLMFCKKFFVSKNP